VQHSDFKGCNHRSGDWAKNKNATDCTDFTALLKTLDQEGFFESVKSVQSVAFLFSSDKLTPHEIGYSVHDAVLGQRVVRPKQTQRYPHHY
jgi:hypothetical protein